MNTFSVLRNVSLLRNITDACNTCVRSFQRSKNPAIRDWVIAYSVALAVVQTGAAESVAPPSSPDTSPVPAE